MIGDPFFDTLMSKREGGEVIFASAGSYSWEVPPGVTSVCVVCVGYGGSGGPSYSQGTPVMGGVGGNGGGLVYCNNITVTPGTTCTINIDSSTLAASFKLPGSPTKQLRMVGRTFSTSGAITGYVTYSGGLGSNSPSAHGGAGGGGAAGYSENGGNARISTLPSVDAAAQGANRADWAGGNGGGGVNLFGSGIPGESYSQGGSWGANGVSGSGPNGGNGGQYGGGGGGGGVGSYSAPGGTGGQGAVRIIWGPGRSFPYNAGPI